MSELGILGVFSGAAAFTGLLISIFFFVNKKMERESRIALGVLFLAISMRILKSVWHYILADYAKVGVGQGLVALSVIGPALYLYFQFSTGRPVKRISYFHVVLPTLALLIAIVEPISFRYLYRYATILILPYLMAALVLHVKTEYQTKSTGKFNSALLIGIFMIVGSFIYQLTVDNILYYSYGAAFASLTVYVFLFLVLTQSSLIYQPQVKPVSDGAVIKVKAAFEEQKLFLTQGITLNHFASEINLPSYLVTSGVSKAYGKTFPEAINHFRIEEVKRRLQNGDHKKMKIEGIAYEAGFNTPSAFYAVFKKETGLTPSQFQRSL